MKFQRSILGTFVAMLGASFMHQASAQWLSGGTTSSGRKSHLEGLDLFCDLSAKTFGGYTIPVENQVKIVTLPKQGGDPTVTPSLTFEGEMFCAEVEPGKTGLHNAKPNSNLDPLVGRFRLVQQRSKNGLIFEGPNALGVRTWTFSVEANPDYPFPELLYTLEPVDAETKALFCEPTVTNCRALYGLQVPANQNDYLVRDIDGDTSPDLALGQVFKFTTITTTPPGGTPTEAAGNWYWGVCHSGAFTAPRNPVEVFANANASHGGVGKVTGFELSAGITRLAVTVSQNDLWNSGGQTGWSNADGRYQNFFAVPNDESGKTGLIGTPDTLAADNQHRLWGFVGANWVRVNEAARGTLVGSVNGTDFYILGTGFDGLAPATGELKLYYWDRPRNDNTGSVSVTVASESIQCNNDDAVPTVTSGAARGERRVEVDGFPILNINTVNDGAGFPFAVLGCAAGSGVEIAFAPNGSPIDLSQGVLVNNSPVRIQGVQVVNNVQRATCDLGQPLADLNLKLNKADFVRAVTPGGTCQNGPLAYSVALGNGNSGWYGGQDTVDVINCSQ